MFGDYMITLRKVTIEDATDITLWKQDPYLKYMALDEDFCITLDNQMEDIRNSIQSKHSIYNIILHDDIPIGYVRVDFMNKSHTYAWLRFALGKMRGHGYMKNALLHMIDMLSKEHVHRIECEVYDYNLISIHLIESLGFMKEGIKRKAHHIENTYHDIYVYGLLLDGIKEEEK